jgi:hypothetical protein
VACREAGTSDVNAVPIASLPVRAELVGPKPLLAQFVRGHLKLLANSTLVHS